jgi:hypothetical protein
MEQITEPSGQRCIADHGFTTEERDMIKHLAIIAFAAAAIGTSVPASAQNFGVGVGPDGVSVGAVRGDRYRDRDREEYRDRRDRDETVVIRRHRERDRDYDRGERRVYIERD